MSTNIALHQSFETSTLDVPSTSCSFTVAELYQVHHGWLFAWLRKKIGCGLDAADLMQDTFARLLQKDSINELKEPRAYLTTIAHGLMVNHLRRRDIEHACLDALANLPEVEVPSPEDLAIMIETLVKIDEMLDGLPSRVRNAFLWFQLEGLTHAQIASRLSVSISSVRQYIAKALMHCVVMSQD